MPVPPLVLRSVKGSNLDADDCDNNNLRHEGRIDEILANPPSPIEISNITQSGTQLTFWLENGDHFGPFTLPQANFRPSVVATISASTHAPALGDANCYKRCTNAGGCVVTVPLNADVPYPVDSELGYLQADDGPVTFEVSTDGPTINIPPGYLAKTAQKGALVTLKKVGEDEWDVGGWLAADVTA